jgi:hypothetical protein
MKHGLEGILLAVMVPFIVVLCTLLAKGAPVVSVEGKSIEHLDVALGRNSIAGADLSCAAEPLRQHESFEVRGGPETAL